MGVALTSPSPPPSHQPLLEVPQEPLPLSLLLPQLQKCSKNAYGVLVCQALVLLLATTQTCAPWRSSLVSLGLSFTDCKVGRGSLPHNL